MGIISPQNEGSIFMTTAAICQTINDTYQKVDSFINAHFVAIAFVTASLALGFFSAGAFLMGAGAGAALHFLIQPKVKAVGNELTPMMAIIAIIGAMASFVAITPSGQAGGLAFQSIPFLCSMAIGANFYRFHGAKA